MGAALLQEDRPLAFVSASFSDSQKQYSQLEKELLSVYYRCKKFEYLLSGHTFVVQTDHQPLLPLVKKPLSNISPRLQRLVMKLIAFDFKLQYKPGKYLIVADTLSRDTHPMNELPTPFLEDKRMEVCRREKWEIFNDNNAGICCEERRERKDWFNKLIEWSGMRTG
ncbi:ZNFX1 [Cordylochernes scorpioides]|uniref:ZNFX1 n=1 Tax=Cordylochernes scorpioides TaxID=51811 RepID=A0ABY6LG23_9ARAC|nr:ZNFX1 [Cordylochernes scorpioides]